MKLRYWIFRKWMPISIWLRRHCPFWLRRVITWKCTALEHFALWLHRHLPEKPLRVFFMDDCDYVVARGPWLAKLWYANAHGTTVEEVSEAAMDQSFVDGEIGDPEAESLTFKEGIADRISAGEAPPFVLCTDGYYC